MQSFRENADRACRCGSVSLVELLRKLAAQNSILFRPTPFAYRVVIKPDRGLGFVQYLREVLKLESCIVAGDMAAEVGNEDVINYLLKEKSSNIFSPRSFLKASENGHLHLFKYLTSYFPYFIDIALEAAVRNGHLETVQYLLDQNLHMNSRSVEKIFATAMKNNHMNIVEILLSVYPSILGMSTIALDASAMTGNLEYVKLFLKHGARESHNALESAAENGHLEVIRYLTEERKTRYATPRAITKAACNGHMDIVLYLAEHRNEGFLLFYMNSHQYSSIILYYYYYYIFSFFRM